MFDWFTTITEAMAQVLITKNKPYTIRIFIITFTVAFLIVLGVTFAFFLISK